ncbi:MAG: type II secretion system protein [Cyanobacteriota bacterium]|nr:type II secretion system protein [Cyanobacteriota bacterium]
MKKRSGFTLAEVLITLGIIGVVAAMTIPTLIQNTNSAKFSAQFKKSVSTLSQAAMMGQAQYDTDFGLTDAVCDETQSNAANEMLSAANDAEGHNATKLTFCALFNSTLQGKTYWGKGSSVVDPKTGGKYTWQSIVTLGDLGNYLVYSLADGSLFGFNKDAKACGINTGEVVNNAMLTSGKLKDCLGFIDANGTATPNKEVTCETGTTSLTPETPCTVPSGSKLGDIYPIVFHDGVVEPASNASKAVLTRGK